MEQYLAVEERATKRAYKSIYRDLTKLIESLPEPSDDLDIAIAGNEIEGIQSRLGQIQNNVTKSAARFQHFVGLYEATQYYEGKDA